MTLVEDAQGAWLYINSEDIRVSPVFQTREIAEHWLANDYGGE